MTTYLSVTPGVDMTRDLGDARLTKKWLREYLRANPQKDFRVHGSSQYVNGEDCIRYDLSLEVRNPRTHDLVAAVEFQSVEKVPAPDVVPNEALLHPIVADLFGLREPVQDTRTPAEVWGYQAVVR